MFHKHGLGDTAGGPAYAMEHFGHLWDFSDWISRFWPIAVGHKETAARCGQLTHQSRCFRPTEALKF